MAKKKEKLSTSEVLVNKTEGWIATHKNVIIAACCIALAVILIAVIVTVVSDKGSNKVDTALATLSSNYDSYLVMDADDENYESSLATVKEEANALVAKPGVKEYAGAKAALILADIAYNDGDYTEAVSLYESVYNAQKDTFLGQVALMSKAAAVEMTGDKSGARELYNQIFDEYGTEGIYASRALFNAARLTEESDAALAVSIYEQLIGEFEEGGSEYAKLAKSRVSQLKINN